MAEHFFALSTLDKQEALEFAAARTGRPAHLLEKDIWVVTALSFLFESPFATDLTFKGGTSLSKAYRVIDRFSEDIDLTYDIRHLIGDLIQDSHALPSSKSQAKKWTDTVKDRLPGWIEAVVQPMLAEALAKAGLKATLEIGGHEREKLFIHYRPLNQGSGYVAPTVQLEFGARATGEPHVAMPVTCDMAGHVPEVTFPTATPLVMKIERTFWEKATAAHVYCLQGRLRGERYARHWYDLAMLAKHGSADKALAAMEIAQMVAEHKSLFFAEKAADSVAIDYNAAISGALRLVPTGSSLDALAADYAAMANDGILLGHALTFEDIIATCTALETQANRPRPEQ